ncbi:MAG: hypothetical protein RBT69_09920 [Spirochaetia bacterium]|jgi:hypothetical protein|nr:hypothetical protein [Spirochaetia bacterium]
MDKYLIDKYYKDFENESLRIDQYMIDKLGLKQINTFITIENLYIYCIPFELSLKKCRIILVLDEDEIGILENKEKKIRIHFKFENDYIPNKKASFYMWINYSNAKQLEKPANAWIADFDIISISGIYQEVLINLFINNKRIMDIYNKKGIGTVFFDRNSLKEISIKEIISINNEKCLIIKLSLTKIFLLVNSLSKSFQSRPEEARQIKIFYGKHSFDIKGTLVKHHELNRMPGLTVAEFNIEYSPYFVELLCKHLISK